MKVELTEKEISMIDTALYVACVECQLPDKGEDGYEDVVKLKKKLGIYKDN